jgi:CHAT domain-containing protein
MRRLRAFVLMLILLGVPGLRAHAQSGDDGGLEGDMPELVSMDPAQAHALLDQALPEAARERHALLQQQARAAEALNLRDRQIAVLAQLARDGPDLPGGDGWVRPYLIAEFTWGSQGKALEASEAFLNDKRLSPAMRASVALRQAYFSAHGTDRGLMQRNWSRADRMAGEQIEQLGADSEAGMRLRIERLQAQSEVERWNGDRAKAVALLRESVRISAHLMAKGKDPMARQYGLKALDGSLGLLCFALVRDGRAPEAVAVAQSHVALWRAGQLDDGFGARWQYRLAHGLIATQAYAEGLAAARESDAMLEQAGASFTSHTRWLAREQMLSALLGLHRWAEADALYQQFLAHVQDDALARQRASDWRLRSLLAAENGRFDEALETVERVHRFRLRLYGAAHPQTQEAAGVRGLVRLLRGDMGGAMSDYEALFTALLDSPGSWLDLDLRGVRGFVLGLALQQFLEAVGQQALAGTAIEPRMADRALQLADRLSLSSTQRALADSTARVLAASPALAEMLATEAQLRHRQSDRAGELASLLNEEDSQRRAMVSEDFKALPAPEREKAKAALKALRESIKTGQARVTDARAALTAQRERIAEAYPAYGDLLMPPTPTSERLRALLAPDEGLLLVHSLDHATLVWLIAPGQRQAVLHVSALGAAELSQRVAALRRMLDLSRPDAPPLQEAPLLALYRELIAPLKPDYGKLHSLIVASSGPLASLPVAALITEAGGAHWLARSAAVTQLPAASALQSLRRTAALHHGSKPLIGFGDPAFRSSGNSGGTGGAKALSAAATRYDAAWGFRYADIPPLPETRQELKGLAAALGAQDADLVLGAAATREAVLAAPLADYRVAAFATHGLMPGELPGVSRPALAMAATGREGESPLLELDDVLGLHLAADWVLLSACNTAAADERGGAAMSGLVRGFFFAGARSVLATHWSVDSAASASLVPAALRGAAGRAESLRQAQLALIDGRVGGGQWAHPYFWAGYALFGDPLK